MRDSRRLRLDLRVGQYDLSEIIFRYAGRCDVRTESGSTFICKLGGGDLRYLHKIFRGLGSSSQLLLDDKFGFSVPAQYASFMARANGVTLFDNSFALYGVIQSLNRSLHLEEQQPISLTSELERHEIVYGRESIWRPIGAVTGFRILFPIYLSRDGHVGVLRNKKIQSDYETFGEALYDISFILSNVSDEQGMSDQSFERVEEIMLSK